MTIAQDTADFLAKGGVIKEIPEGYRTASDTLEMLMQLVDDGYLTIEDIRPVKVT